MTTARTGLCVSTGKRFDMNGPCPHCDQRKRMSTNTLVAHHVLRRRCDCGAILGLRESCAVCAANERERLQAKRREEAKPAKPVDADPDVSRFIGIDFGDRASRGVAVTARRDGDNFVVEKVEHFDAVED